MNKMQKLILAAVGVAAFNVMGCNDSGDGPVYADQQPTYVIVADAPPDPIIEVIPSSPGPDYVWVGGYYSWGGGRYTWEGGRWSVPPRGGGVWVAPRYDRQQGGGRFTAGHWQSGSGQASPQRRQPAAPFADRAPSTNQPTNRRLDAAPSRDSRANLPNVDNSNAARDANAHAAVGKTSPRPAAAKKPPINSKDAPFKGNIPKDKDDGQKQQQDSK